MKTYGNIFKTISLKLNVSVIDDTTNTTSTNTDINFIEQQIDFNFSDILNTVKTLYENKPDKSLDIERIYNTYKFYLDKKADMNEIIIELLKTNNMNAIGHVFIRYLTECIHKSYTFEQTIFSNIVKILIMCFGKIIISNDKIYISNHTLKDVQIFIADLYV